MLRWSTSSRHRSKYIQACGTLKQWELETVRGTQRRQRKQVLQEETLETKAGNGISGRCVDGREPTWQRQGSLVENCGKQWEKNSRLRLNLDVDVRVQVGVLQQHHQSWNKHLFH